MQYAVMKKRCENKNKKELRVYMCEIYSDIYAKKKKKKVKSKAIQQLYLGKVPLGGGGVAENKCKTLNGSKKRTHMNPIAPAHA